MAISRRLRYEILRRDNNTCRYCGQSAPDVPLTVDHVIPVALGGSDTPDNLVTACRDCNSGKSATPPDATLVADVAEDALRWSTAMEAAAETQRQKWREDDWFVADCLDRWNDWKLNDDTTVPYPESASGSLLTFRNHGLSVLDIHRCIDIAMKRPRIATKETWRYFCGVAWRALDDRRKQAIEALKEEDSLEYHSGIWIYEDPWSGTLQLMAEDDGRVSIRASNHHTVPCNNCGAERHGSFVGPIECKGDELRRGVETVSKRAVQNAAPPVGSDV